MSELEKFRDISDEPMYWDDNLPEIVCGPISTGGRGSIAENLRAFEAVITCLTHRGRPIFSQLPYEDKIFELRSKWQALPGNEGKYFMPILTEFYLPLFQKRMFKRAFFLPGWESSTGTAWERGQLTVYCPELIDLTYEWVSSIIDNPYIDRWKPVQAFFEENRNNFESQHPGRYLAIVGETMDHFYGKDYDAVRRHFPPMMPWGQTVLCIQLPPKPR